LSTSVWTHVGFTYDGSTTIGGLKTFVNGAEATKTDNITDFGTGDMNNIGNVTISSRNGDDLMYTGLAFQATLYDKELSGAEVTALYNGGTQVDATLLSTEPNLVGYWQCGDADTYPTITDRSSSGNDGTMTNMEAGDFVTDAP